MKSFPLVVLMLISVSGCMILEGSGGELGMDFDDTKSLGDPGDGDVGGEDEEDPAPYGRIFVTSGTVTGLSAWVDPGEIGYENLDALCQTEADNRDLDWWGRGELTGTAGHYRAIVAFNGHRPRTACASASCVTDGADEHVGKWPLKPESLYVREDGVTPIGTTNSSGVFDFPLQNSVIDTPNFPETSHVWTGLNQDWTTYGFGMSYNCFSNISNSTGYNQYAFADAADATAFSIGNPTTSGMGEGGCDKSYPIMCAEILPTILPVQPSYRKVFLTTETYSATLGVSGFDNACQTEANASGLGFGGRAPYKALVQSPNSRLAIHALGQYVAGPLNWVMEANREYRRADGTTVIGTTNAQAALDFPLANSLTGSVDSYWTGFGRTDLFYNGDAAHPFSVNNIIGQGIHENCASFTTADSGYTGRVGNGTTTDASAFGGGQAGCNTSHKLLCVEQTRENYFYD